MIYFFPFLSWKNEQKKSALRGRWKNTGAWYNLLLKTVIPWNNVLSILPNSVSFCFGPFGTCWPNGPMCLTFAFWLLKRKSSAGNRRSLYKYLCNFDTMPKLFIKIGFSSTCSNRQNFPSLSDNLNLSLKYSSALMIPRFFFLLIVSLSINWMGTSTWIRFRSNLSSFDSSTWFAICKEPLWSIEMWVELFCKVACSFLCLSCSIYSFLKLLSESNRAWMSGLWKREKSSLMFHLNLVKDRSVMHLAWLAL